MPRCLETIDVCIWRRFVFMSTVVPWVVQCCLFCGPDCSYILPGLELLNMVF